jgi:hypothetical protein
MFSDYSRSSVIWMVNKSSTILSGHWYLIRGRPFRDVIEEFVSHFPTRERLTPTADSWMRMTIEDPPPELSTPMILLSSMRLPTFADGWIGAESAFFRWMVPWYWVCTTGRWMIRQLSWVFWNEREKREILSFDDKNIWLNQRTTRLTQLESGDWRLPEHVFANSRKCFCGKTELEKSLKGQQFHVQIGSVTCYSYGIAKNSRRWREENDEYRMITKTRRTLEPSIWLIE